jgi:hypothetical protein
MNVVFVVISALIFCDDFPFFTNIFFIRIRPHRSFFVVKNLIKEKIFELKKFELKVFYEIFCFSVKVLNLHNQFANLIFINDNV